MATSKQSPVSPEGYLLRKLLPGHGHLEAVAKVSPEGNLLRKLLPGHGHLEAVAKVDVENLPGVPVQQQVGGVPITYTQYDAVVMPSLIYDDISFYQCYGSEFNGDLGSGSIQIGKS